MSASKWFADENEDTGLQTLENSKFLTSHLRSYLSAMKARSCSATRNVVCSAHRAVWSDRWNA